MKNPLLPSLSISRRGARQAGVLALAVLGGWLPAARAQQASPKTADIAFQVAADGSMNMAFQLTFDAANWRAWKAMVGEEPARMRAQMRHQFAAMTLEDFKLDRDDMNRVAKMSMHSPSGPELREDGAFQFPVDGYFRLVNHAGRDWFFSGNNPNAGGALNNVKVTLPAEVTDAHVINADDPAQALVFSLAAAPSPGRWFSLAGGLVALAGLALVLFGWLGRRKPALALPAGQTPLLPKAGVPLACSPSPVLPPVFVPPPTVPPSFTPRQTNRVPPPFAPRSAPEPPVVPEESASSSAEPPSQPEKTTPPAKPPPFRPSGGYIELG